MYSLPNGDRSLQRHIILLKCVTAMRLIFLSDSKYVLGRWPWNRSRWSCSSLGYIKTIWKLSVCRSVTSGSGNWQASSTTKLLEPCRIGWTTTLQTVWMLQGHVIKSLMVSIRHEFVFQPTSWSDWTMGPSMSCPSPTVCLIELLTIWWMGRGRPTTRPLGRPAYTISVFFSEGLYRRISLSDVTALRWMEKADGPKKIVWVGVIDSQHHVLDIYSKI
jgi:hypothetical protein